MVLKFFNDNKRIIESENLHNLFIFRLDGIVIIFTNNEQYITSCEDINEFVIKIKGGYYLYTINGNNIDTYGKRYDEFFIFNSIMDDIHLSQMIFLREGRYWEIYNTETDKLVSKKRFLISDNNVNSLKKDNSLYELHMKDEDSNDVILDLLTAELL